MNSANKKPEQRKFLKQESQPPENLIDDWSGKLRPLFVRYGWDILAVILLTFAVITLLALLQWTNGNLVTPLRNFLYRWFGYGSYAIVLVFIALAIWVFRRRLFGKKIFPLSRILLIEMAYFAFLGFVSISGGTQLSRAEAGLDGGIVGWGIAELALRFVPVQIASLVFVLLIALGISYGSGLITWLGNFIDRQIATYVAKYGDQVNSPDVISDIEGKPVNVTKDERSKEKLRKKPVTNLVMTPAALIQRDKTLPPYSILAKEQVVVMDEVQVLELGKQIEQTLEEFGIPAKVAGYRVGPTVTQFAVEPGFVEREGPDGTTSKHKVRVSQISSLAKDLALALSAERLRIEAPVPGQSYVGIEIPNPESKMVRLRPILESEAFQRLNSPLGLALGQDVSGQAVVADLSKMPHLLIAGTTGSGKSVYVTAITTCLLINNSPADLRLAMMDPKMVELVRFNGVPHLLGKVETSIERMIGVLRWAIAEMDQRYRLLEDEKARDLDAYNLKMSRKKQPTLPRVVVVIDELADLMMSAPDQTENSLVRLAQMARAVGIHLIVATQRPSTDVVTGLIKANFPARISFTVASSIDSRVILDTSGAETLMGKGDMLFLAPDVGSPQRAQGALVTDQEINQLIQFWQTREAESPEEKAPWEDLMKVMDEHSDDLVTQAMELVKKTQRASASFLQRRLRIGFPRAARLLDQLEEMGVVGPNQGGGRDREVLVGPDDNSENETDLED